MEIPKCDFWGWATKNDLKCSDGRVIRHNAFKDDDGKKVPLVWMHDHSSPFSVLGYAILKNLEHGVAAFCTFNDTEQGQNGKELVTHGDVVSLSICANQVKQVGSDVLHGAIREVSLVLAGANPGATIENVINHGEMVDDEVNLWAGEPISIGEFEHADEKKDDKQEAETNSETEEDKKTKKKTIGDIINTMNDEQKEAVYALAAAIDGNTDGEKNETEDKNDDTEKDVVKQSNENEEETTLKHNAFDKTTDDTMIIHSEDMKATLDDWRKFGSLRESAIAHNIGDISVIGESSSTSFSHGIQDVDYLFPDAKNVTTEPTMIMRDQSWVTVFMNGVRRSPFSRIKSIFANLTEEDARAKGYIKGKYKKEQVFGLLKRTTTPTTIYKKQKMDRDDIIDITDFSVVDMIKREMRMMLNEEIARAALIGDGRSASSDDKINEMNIRPIWTDEDLFTIKAGFTAEKGANDDATTDNKAKAFIKAAIRARKDYKGSGNPTLFTTEDVLTACLLLTDSTGRDLYTDEAQLARKLRVSRIVTVPVMEGQTRTVDMKTHELWGIIVNLNDYRMGADRNGQVSLFEDFDLDYNAQLYLIETRCSGALVVPYSAIALEFINEAG